MKYAKSKQEDSGDKPTKFFRISPKIIVCSIMVLVIAQLMVLKQNTIITENGNIETEFFGWGFLPYIYNNFDLTLMTGLLLFGGISFIVVVMWIDIHKLCSSDFCVTLVILSLAIIVFWFVNYNNFINLEKKAELVLDENKIQHQSLDSVRLDSNKMLSFVHSLDKEIPDSIKDDYYYLYNFRDENNTMYLYYSSDDFNNISDFKEIP